MAPVAIVILIRFCKMLHHYVTLVLILIPLVTLEVLVNIVPETYQPCSTCLTLDDFADRTLQMNAANDTTLLLESGEHFLSSYVTFMNVNSFSLLSRTGRALVTCRNLPAGFKFSSIAEVKLVGITFIGCGSLFPFSTSVFEFLGVDNAMIDECWLISSKGKVIVSKESSIKFNRSVVKNSSCDVGVTWFETSVFVIENSSFVGNWASNLAVIYAYNCKKLKVIESTFESNLLGLVGVIQLVKSEGTFVNIKMFENRCYVCSLYIFESSVESHGRLTMFRNQAILSSLCVIRSKMTIMGEFSFVGNYGSFFVENSDVNFNGLSDLSNNRARQRGGALTTIQSRVHFRGVTMFGNNSAKIGGAIIAYESKLHITSNMSVLNNFADRAGGGLYLYQSEIVCDGFCTISRNTAAGGVGGGIYAFSSSIILGSKLFREQEVSTSNSLIFAANTATSGGGISLESYSRIYGIGNNGSNYIIRFLRNNASHTGGAVHINDYSTPDTCDSQSFT